MNKKLTIPVAIVSIFSVFIAATALKAQTKTISAVFSQANASAITAVDTNNRTITVSYPQLALACSSLTNCQTGKSPDILREGEVMAINALDQVENDFTKMKVGDSVTVYFKSDGSTSTPYALKDFTLVPPGCDRITRICSGSGTTTPATTITQNLSAGISNDQVLTLQFKLQGLGYFPRDLQPTGYFGSVTKKAVTDFQTAKGLPATGFVGPMTRNSLGQ